MKTWMTRTRIGFAGVALAAVTVPACLQLPSPTRDAVTRAPADQAAATATVAAPTKAAAQAPEVTVSRRPPPPRVRYIDPKSVKVSPADDPDVVTVKGEQLTAPPALNLPTIDKIPVIESAPTV